MKTGGSTLSDLKDEKRKHTRVLFNTRVRLKCNDVEILSDADARDISFKGMFVTTDQKLPIGSKCEIKLLLTGSSTRLSIDLDGKIVRHGNDGLGILFEGIELDSYFHLKNLILYNSKDP